MRIAMITALLLAASLAAAQDPKPAKSVEERLKELEAKIGALEKKQQTLAAENGALEQRIAEAGALREKSIRQVAAGWVQRHAPGADFSAAQSAAIEELWVGWMKEDGEKPADAARWKAREEALRGKLAPDQISKVARKVREEQVQMARAMLSSVTQSAQLAPDRAAGFEKIVLSKLVPGENVLLPQAHATLMHGWTGVVSAIEGCLPELGSVLTAEELAKVRESLGRWKPKK